MFPITMKELLELCKALNFTITIKLIKDVHSITLKKGHAYRFSKIYICLLGTVLNGSHLFLNITTWFRPCATKHKDRHF